jgi:hypothetical protein
MAVTRAALLGLIAYALAVSFYLSRPASGQALACAERDHLAAFLESRHGLSLHSWGLPDAMRMNEGSPL